jgi:F-type H+-transporting ATPase subunit a
MAKFLGMLVFAVLLSIAALAQDTHTTPSATPPTHEPTASPEHGGEAHTADAGHSDPAHGGESKEEGIDIKEILFDHVGDKHDWHILDWNGHAVSVPLPVLIYDQAKGFSAFLSNKFGHVHKGHGSQFGQSEAHNGYKLSRDLSKGIKEEIVNAETGSKAGIYDFSITKNVFSMFISIAILLSVMFAVAKRSKRNGTTKAPTGIQNAIEPIITFIRDNVARPFLGAANTKYMPLLLTIFFFVWINNLLGLLPFGFNLTGNIAFTAMLALVYFVVMLFSSKKYFWGHTLNPPGVPLAIKFILVPIEILGIFIKPVALCLRLFANIFAGHTIILCVLSLIFIFTKQFNTGVGIGSILISVPFTIFMFFIELLVAAIQAFIFTNLSAVFIGQAIEEHHHDDAHHDAHGEVGKNIAH